MKKALVIFNPVSGKSKSPELEENIKSYLKKQNITFVWYTTHPDEHYENLFNKTYQDIIVCGGDGTIACVIRAMMHDKVKTPLIIVPTGSANLLSITLHLPFYDPIKALEKGLKGKVRALDLMCVNNKYYGVIAAGRGYDALLIHETSRELKRKLGFFAYVWMFCKTFLSTRVKKFTVTIDGKTSEYHAHSVMVFNAFPLLPFKPRDGILNAIILKRNGIISIGKGRIIKIHSEEEKRFQIDGEKFFGTELHIHTVPLAIKIKS